MQFKPLIKKTEIWCLPEGPLEVTGGQFKLVRIINSSYFVTADNQCQSSPAGFTVSPHLQIWLLIHFHHGISRESFKKVFFHPLQNKPFAALHRNGFWVDSTFTFRFILLPWFSSGNRFQCFIIINTGMDHFCGCFGVWWHPHEQNHSGKYTAEISGIVAPSLTNKPYADHLLKIFGTCFT